MVEEAGAGIGLIQELKSDVPGVTAVKPEGIPYGRSSQLLGDRELESLKAPAATVG
jgi:hypothetical protein